MTARIEPTTDAGHHRPRLSGVEEPRRRPQKRVPEPVVITGIGLIASVGGDREQVWQAVRHGVSGVRSLSGLKGIPDGLLIGAPVELPPSRPGRLKVIDLCQTAAAEAIDDAGIEGDAVDRDRIGCAISGHIGDTWWLETVTGYGDERGPDAVPWHHQFLPSSACVEVANRFGLYGPRLCHSTACASGLVEVLAAARAIRDGQCDLALAGSGEAFHPIFAAGFRQMRVLAMHDDPEQACRPFDLERRGFVMGEGAGMLVLERLSHAVARGARIYAQLCAGRMHAEAHHVTGLDADCDALTHLIGETLDQAQLAPHDVHYINAHGTGTQQNDLAEARAIRRALGRSADGTCVSATKSMLGHLVNASGSVELGITILALRDGFAPPTMNLTHPDPECDLDCVPLRGRSRRLDTALKLSVAFGGHLVAVALRRWDSAGTQMLPVRRPTAA